MSPQISLIVPAYQTEATLGETLEAIVQQTFTDWECIVVDDGSTDGTAAVAADFAADDRRICVIHQPNQGTAAAYNSGVSIAKAQLIGICSADDVLLTDHLASMAVFIQREPEYDIYSTHGYRWWPGRRRELDDNGYRGQGTYSLRLAEVIRECFYGVGAVYRRAIWETAGGYRPGTYGEDYDLWLRAMASGARHRCLPEPLSLHRISSQQKSARMSAAHDSNIEILSNLRGNYPLSAPEDRAVAEAIAHHERRIAQLGLPRFVPRALVHLTVRLFGTERAWRAYSMVRRH